MRFVLKWLKDVLLETEYLFLFSVVIIWRGRGVYVQLLNGKFGTRKQKPYPERKKSSEFGQKKKKFKIRSKKS